MEFDSQDTRNNESVVKRATERTSQVKDLLNRASNVLA